MSSDHTITTSSTTLQGATGGSSASELASDSPAHWRTSRQWHPGCIVAALGVLLLLASPALLHADPTVTFERWYSLLLQDQPAGWMHAEVAQDGDVITSTTRMHVAMRRGPMTMEIGIDTTFRETAAGVPLEATQVQKMGAMAIRTTMRFDDDQIHLTTEQNGQSQEQTFPKPAQAWLPPAAAQRYIQAQLADGVKEIRYHSIDPSSGPRPHEMHLTVLGPENVEVIGKVVPAIAWQARTSAMPGMVTHDFVDQQGHVIRSSTTMMPGMEMAVIQADERVARGEIKPPELMLSTLVEPKGDIADPRVLRHATYRMRFAAVDAQTPRPDLPSTAAQQVKWLDERTAEVVVNLQADQGEPAEWDLSTYLQSSIMLNKDDAAVRQLAERAVAKLGPDATAAAKAEAMRHFVYQFIQTKDLSIGLASASEVARTAQGDCTEHAVLLAAMLRAGDVPSRVVTGLAYIDEFLGRRGVFGYHMWTQAWVDGRWLDLDPALSATVPFDAAHIALSTSAMADGAMNEDMATLVAIIGRLSIEVVQSGP